MFKHTLLCAFALLFSTITYADGDDSARDRTPVHGISDTVQLISEQKATYPRSNIEIKRNYPQLETADDNVPIDPFNDQVDDFITKEMDKFKVMALDSAAYAKKMNMTPEGASLWIDYSSAVLSGKNAMIVSVEFNIEGMIGRMAHPSHYHSVINYDLKKGVTLKLADLFAPDANYLAVLSEVAKAQLTRRLGVNYASSIESGTLPTEDNFKNWNIKDDGILITFDEYQVAPYAAGPQTALIPWRALKEIINKDSAIGVCATKRKCLQPVAVTGEFVI